MGVDRAEPRVSGTPWVRGSERCTWGRSSSRVHLPDPISLPGVRRGMRGPFLCLRWLSHVQACSSRRWTLGGAKPPNCGFLFFPGGVCVCVCVCVCVFVSGCVVSSGRECVSVGAVLDCVAVCGCELGEPGTTPSPPAPHTLPGAVVDLGCVAAPPPPLAGGPSCRDPAPQPSPASPIPRRCD